MTGRESPPGDEQHRRLPARRYARLLPMLTILAALAFAGCSTRTIGMQAPLAHDYDGMQWRPLDATVQQRIVIAPGYTALVENDPATDSETLQARIRELPDDVRSATLVEIWVAVRPAEERSFSTELNVSMSVEGSDEGPVRIGFGDLHVEDDWLIIEELPEAFAGDVVQIEVGPAAGWEYGFTVDRAPYGGFAATIAAGAGETQTLNGSLGYETVFEQSTDRSRLFEEDAGPAVWKAITDPLLASVYGLVLVLGSAFWFVRHNVVKKG